jgi:hypothetical protein
MVTKARDVVVAEERPEAEDVSVAMPIPVRRAATLITYPDGDLGLGLQRFLAGDDAAAQTKAAQMALASAVKEGAVVAGIVLEPLPSQ